MTNDLIEILYFDAQRIQSLISQFEEGLIANKEIRNTSAENKKTNIGGSVKIVSGEAEDTLSKSSSNSFILSDFHNIVPRLLSHLNAGNFLLNTDRLDDFSDDNIRDQMRHGKFINFKGQCQFFDYNSLKHMADNFQELVDIISYCACSELIQNQISIVENDDRKLNEKARAKIENEILSNFKSTTFPKVLHEKFTQAISRFTEIAYSDQIAFRFSCRGNKEPFLQGRLKRDCFVDGDSQYCLSAYGSQTNVDLEVLASITSIPFSENEHLDSGQEKSYSDEIEEFSESFSDIFLAIEDFHTMLKGLRYPNINIYPLAIFRKISP